MTEASTYEIGPWYVNLSVPLWKAVLIGADICAGASMRSFSTMLMECASLAVLRSTRMGRRLAATSKVRHPDDPNWLTLQSGAAVIGLEGLLANAQQYSRGLATHPTLAEILDAEVLMTFMRLFHVGCVFRMYACVYGWPCADKRDWIFGVTDMQAAALTVTHLADSESFRVLAGGLDRIKDEWERSSELVDRTALPLVNHAPTTRYT